MAFSTASGSISSEINVTPLIDVLLVLLIIFMVIVPVAPHGLGASVPQPASHTPQVAPEQPLVVRVDPSGEGPQYQVNGRMVRPAAFESEMAGLLAVRAEKDVFLQGSPDLDLDAVASTMDRLRAVGATRIGILTTKDVAAMGK